MPQYRKQIAMNDAAEFLSRSFTSEETIAILLRRVSPTMTVQRIVTLECALGPRYLGVAGIRKRHRSERLRCGESPACW